jgi:AbrB family looped-hinge helix DNA binding protein
MMKSESRHIVQVSRSRSDDSLRICIPQEIARQLGLAEGARVEIRAEGDRMIIAPVRDLPVTSKTSSSA